MSAAIHTDFESFVPLGRAGKRPSRERSTEGFHEGVTDHLLAEWGVGSGGGCELDANNGPFGAIIIHPAS